MKQQYILMVTGTLGGTFSQPVATYLEDTSLEHNDERAKEYAERILRVSPVARAADSASLWLGERRVAWWSVDVEVVLTPRKGAKQ